MLDRFERLRRDEFGLDEGRYAHLAAEIDRWRTLALELARQRDLDRNRGRDLGLGLER